MTHIDDAIKYQINAIADELFSIKYISNPQMQQAAACTVISLADELRRMIIRKQEGHQDW